MTPGRLKRPPDSPLEVLEGAVGGEMAWERSESDGRTSFVEREK